MTIKRTVTQGEKVIEVTYPVPGFEEDIKHSISDGEAITVHVDSDEQVTVKYFNITPTEYSERRKLREEVTLSKLDINNHSIQSKPSPLRKRVISYTWVPTHIHLRPEQELAIKELIDQGVYSPEEAQEVREQMLFELQKELRDEK